MSMTKGVKSGVHIQSCGHHMHYTCRKSYCDTLKQANRLPREQPLDTESGEFICPVCRLVPFSKTSWAQTQILSCISFQTIGKLSFANPTGRVWPPCNPLSKQWAWTDNSHREEYLRLAQGGPNWHRKLCRAVLDKCTIGGASLNESSFLKMHYAFDVPKMPKTIKMQWSCFIPS